MKCFNCKNELAKLKENWWVCSECDNQYPTGSFNEETSENSIDTLN